MTMLCTSELIQLTCFSAIAWFVGETVFYVMFLAGAIGAHVVRRSVTVQRFVVASAAKPECVN